MEDLVSKIMTISAILCVAFIPFSDVWWLDIGLVVMALTSIGIVIIKYRKRHIVQVMTLCACLVIPITKWIEPALVNQTLTNTKKALQSDISLAQSTTTQFFLNNASALDSLNVLVSTTEFISDELYQGWLEQILPANRNQFLNVALSENLIVKHVYPTIPQNTEVLNVDLGLVPQQGLLYRNSDATHTNVTIGPVMLLQGVPGIIYVRPTENYGNRALSGVLSLEYLKQALGESLPNIDQLYLALETPTSQFNLIGETPLNPISDLSRRFKVGDIDVYISVNSTELLDEIEKAHILSRTTAASVWLGLSLLLNWNFRTNQQQRHQRSALEKSNTELESVQRLGQLGSWWAKKQDEIHSSKPLEELLQHALLSFHPIELKKILHPTEYEKVSTQIQDFFDNDKSELLLEHRFKINNSYRWLEHRLTMSKNRVFSGVIRDIHEMKEHNEKVVKLESFDPLTGLTNQRCFQQHASEKLSDCHASGTGMALIIINIDDFRSINEMHGQATGDQLLKLIAYRLQSTLNASDVVARLFGDTFALTYTDVENQQQYEAIADQISRELKEPYPLNGTIFLQFSVGIAVYPLDGDDFGSLLQAAETALSSAKSEMRGQYRFYSAELSKQSIRRQNILSLLPRAIKNNYLNLVYQPRVCGLKNGNDCHSMEALIRWNDPDLGFVSPGEFIPIIEDSNLIVDVGNWVIDQSFSMISTYKDKLPKDLKVSINLSPHQLEDPLLVPRLTQALKQYDLSASCFELEVTEHSISEKSSTIITNMLDLSNMGFTFALDDFGTGYSNLGVLQSLPLNVLKIDMRFIRSIGLSEKSDELVRAILNMGHSLGLKVVAEGVETDEQVAFLKNIHCDELQGYYYFKPTNIVELIEKYNMHDIKDV